MDLDEALAFARPRHQGVLTTLRRDGRPQVSNIAYALGDDDIVRISVTGSRAKSKNLRRDHRATLYVPGDTFWQYLVLDGEADLTPEAAAPDDATVAELISVYRAVQGEHPDWDEYGAAMVSEGRLVIRLRPTHAYGMIGN
ncbi:MAG: PPOX class F420-dependent oxidoreductase [Acidimicrobiales bacterium]